MTEKLFWQDPYQREFTATIQEQFPSNEGTAVVLDRTCFYATSGGQPNDTGSLNSVPVTDVRLEKNRLVHIAEAAITDSEVHGRINWNRRFDHMQQHSGQHVLSAAFYNLFRAETSSFHLGADYCSIELNQQLNERQIGEAEESANQVLFNGTPVTAFFVDAEKAHEYPLRKQSDLAEALRLIQIGDFDLSPCSGTHVKNAAEVGLIFITGFERLANTTRISFLCGNRIRITYKNDLGVLKLLSKNLTTSFELLPDSISKLQMQIKEMRKELSGLKQERLKTLVPELLHASQQRHEYRLVIQIMERPYEDVRFLAQQLMLQPAVAGALASSTDRRIAFFKHPQTQIDIKRIFEIFKQQTSVKGGGAPHFMEAGNWPESVDALRLLQSLFL